MTSYPYSGGTYLNSTPVALTVTELTGAATMTFTGPTSIPENTTQVFTGSLKGVGGVPMKWEVITHWLSTDNVNWTQLSGSWYTSTTDGTWSVSVYFDVPGTFYLKAKWAGGTGRGP